jgi:predicted  nucleic acid-binding Zn-ribbon protein
MKTSMNADLEKLIELQKLETEIRHLETLASQVPEEKAELDRRLQEEKVRVDTLREEVASTQKRRRQLEADLQDLEAKRSKYKGQLMEVKTNKEYTAMLHEIEGTEREIRAREDSILVEMEKGEEQGAALKNEERVFKEAEEKHRSEGKALDETAVSLSSKAAAVKGMRDTVAATISEEPLFLFKRVASLRGSGVAEARDGMCQVCHLKLRPQMWLEVRRNDSIYQCQGCNRILFYEPAPATVAPQP